MAKFSTVELPETSIHAASDASPWAEETARYIPRLPIGKQTFWGIPFELKAGGEVGRSLLVTGANGGRTRKSIPIGANCTYLVFAHFCDSRAAKTTPVGNLADPQTGDYVQPVVTAPGEHLADYVLVYDDESEHRAPIRRRFEINQVATRMQSAFAARPHQDLTPLDHRGPYPSNEWGRMQTGVFVGPHGPTERVQPVDQSRAQASWSIHALPNPRPEVAIREIRIEPTGAAAIGIGGITLFHGQDHPLRHEDGLHLRGDPSPRQLLDRGPRGQ